MCIDDNQSALSLDIDECRQSFDAGELRVLLEDRQDPDRKFISEIIDMYDKGSITLDQTLLKILAVFCDF